MSLIPLLSLLLIPCIIATQLPSALPIHQQTSTSRSANPILQMRGTGWGFSDLSEMNAVRNLGWWYNWGTRGQPDAVQYAVKHGMEFVPMQWGGANIDRLEEVLQAGATDLLGFNEPNHNWQANIPPAEAAAMWPQLEAVADKLGMRLGAPAAAPCGAHCINMNPFDWWDQFFGNCTTCRIDFLPTHYYNCNPNTLKWYIDTCYEKYKLPVWLTEFDCPNGMSGSMERQYLYMLQALKILDNHPGVERYAWYAIHTKGGWIGPTASLLQPTNATLSLLGEAYLNYGTGGNYTLEFGLHEDDIIAPLAAPNGGWLAHCAPCLAKGVQGLADAQGMATAELQQHIELCQECGFHVTSLSRSDGSVTAAE